MPKQGAQRSCGKKKSKFVKPSVLAERVKDGKTFRQIEVTEVNYKKPENLRERVVLSSDVNDFLSKKDTVHLRDERITEFFSKTKNFYIAACTYITKMFPMKEKLLKMAEVADVTQRLNVTEDHVKYFLTRFPCLIPAGSSVDDIISEFITYQSHDMIPTLQKDEVDATWIAIGQVKDAAGVPMFQQVSAVMLGILCIPHSNAACERIFSCVRKNHTDQRASLSSETIDNLMVVKSQPEMPYEKKYSKEQLRKIKSAYHLHLQSNR